ncbi:MAG: hypothetical protein LAN63_07585 [Acidobacteriia bacterium]|nr:hypothetical protein [Terriglobia bacterium]
MLQRSRFALAALGLIVLATTCVPLLRAQSPELPPGPLQAKVTTACTECHEARIILQQRLGKPAWTKEVDKMIKWGAVVDPSDRDGFIEYLSANFPIDRPPYEAGKTSAQKKKK